MAPKIVYGKRPHREGPYAISRIFESSSPSRPEKDQHATVNDAASGLENLSIQGNIRYSPKLSPWRKALFPRDTNPQPEAGTCDGNQGDPSKAPSQRLETPPRVKKEAGLSKQTGTVISQALPERPKETGHVLTGSSEDQYIAPLLSLCGDINGTTSPTPFFQWSNTLEPYFNIVKIAEASYGEVYRLSLKRAHPQFTSSDESVLKILALKPSPDGSDKDKKSKAQREKEDLMSPPQNVAAEVRLLQRMAPIPGFTNFRDLRILRGRPSPAFAAAWQTFNQSRPKGDKSIFPDPSRKASYDDQQLWAVIEMQDAGTDLEHFQLPSIWGVWDVFWGVTLALGKGEREAMFEHRDLHLGNICVRGRRKESGSAIKDGCIKHLKRKLGFSGLETTIIDYTLSRAEMIDDDEGSSSGSCPDMPKEIAYLDLDAEYGLFDGHGHYQYDIYRFMRSAMYFSDPTADYGSRMEEAKTNGRKWAGFHPQTNIVWLHFVLNELLQSLQCWPSQDMSFTLQNLSEKEDQTLAKRKAKELEAALKKLKRILSIKKIPNDGLASAVDLIAMALDHGWLGEGDVSGQGIGSTKDLLEDP